MSISASDHSNYIPNQQSRFEQTLMCHWIKSN